MFKLAMNILLVNKYTVGIKESKQIKPIYTEICSFSLEDFFQGIMMDDLLLNLWIAVKIPIRKRKPTMVPVAISRAKSQAGFEPPSCFDSCSALDRCFGFTTG